MHIDWLKQHSSTAFWTFIKQPLFDFAFCPICIHSRLLFLPVYLVITLYTSSNLLLTLYTLRARTLRTLWLVSYLSFVTGGQRFGRSNSYYVSCLSVSVHPPKLHFMRDFTLHFQWNGRCPPHHPLHYRVTHFAVSKYCFFLTTLIYF